LSNLPNLSFQIDNTIYELEPKHYVTKDYDNMCSLGLQSLDTEAEGVGVILGDMFIKTYYTHFDYKKLKVGFATKAELTTEWWRW